MRYDCIAAYGNNAINTPNLDRCANNGVNFHNCYSQNPLCMPSRASFMTGLYPQQTGVTTNGYSLAPDFEPIMPKLLKGAGFVTAHIGKLHLQPHEDHDLRDDPIHSYGFDTFLRSEERGCYKDAWTDWLAEEYPQYLEAFRLPRPTAPDRHFTEKQGSVVEAPWQASHSGWVAEASCRYMKQIFDSNQSRPMFVNVGIYNPHPPLNPTRDAFTPYEKADIPRRFQAESEWLDKPEPLSTMLQSRADWTEADFLNYRRYFYALVTEMDYAVGHLLDFLEANNALDSTLIIFTSDHGDMCGDHSMTHKGPHFYDEVMHVPLIMHWPDGCGSTRRNIDGLVELVDILPTMLDVSGAEAPPMLQGQSLAKFLRGDEGASIRDDVFAYDQCGAMLRTAEHKYIRYGNDEEVLFDMRDENPEVKNLISDPAFAPMLQSLQQRMLARMIRAGQSSQQRRFQF
jgi:arylsulfatase A-like enzyme